MPGSATVVVYGEGFGETNDVVLEGPVYTLDDLTTPLCQVLTGACAETALPAAVNAERTALSTAVPTGTTSGLYYLRARRGDVFSSTGAWLAVEEAAKTVPIVAPEDHIYAKRIWPGQTVTGTFVEAGDPDGVVGDFNGFYFLATAGSTISASLERVDGSIPWEHPDSIDPELVVVAPDGFVYQNLVKYDDQPGVDLDASLTKATLPLSGLYLILAQTTRGHGAYRLSFDVTSMAPAGAGERVVPLSDSETTVALGELLHPVAFMLDPRGWPVSGASATFTVETSPDDTGNVTFPDGATVTTGPDGSVQADAQGAALGLVEYVPTFDDDLSATAPHLVTVIEAADAEGVAEVGDRIIPRYPAVAWRPFSIGGLFAGGTVKARMGPVATLPLEDRAPRHDVRRGVAAGRVEGAPAARPDARTAGSLRVSEAIHALAADPCSRGKFRGKVASQPLHLPLTLTLTDLSPSVGSLVPNGPVGPEGVHGHRVRDEIRLQIEVRDADGHVPPEALVRVRLGGESPGAVIFVKGVHEISCSREATFTITNGSGVFKYRLGPTSRFLGVVPDPGQPLQVKPVWGTTAGLSIRVDAPDKPTVTLPVELSVGVRPEPGKPHHFACWESTGEACGDVFRFFSGYVDGSLIASAYHLEDELGNTPFGYTDTEVASPGGGLTVRFNDQVLAADPTSYTLDVTWSSTPPIPPGSYTADLRVSVPADVDPPKAWEEDTISQPITLEIDSASTYLLMPKQGYDGRVGLGDCPSPLNVPPAADQASVPLVGDGSPARLVLLAVEGTRLPSSLVDWSDEPSLDRQHVYRNQAGSWTWVSEPNQDARLVTEPGGTFRLELIDASGAIVEGTRFRVHHCPRGEHLTAPEVPPTSTCMDQPVDSDGETGILPELLLNPSGTQRGYLGVELLEGPSQPGMYFLNITSTGSTPYRIRSTSFLNTRATPAAELQGAYPFLVVRTAAFLDSNFQYTSRFDVRQPTPFYVALTDVGELADTISVDLKTTDESGGFTDAVLGLTLTRVGRSVLFLSEPVELHPGWTEPGTSGTKKLRAAPTGTIRAYRGSEAVAESAASWRHDYELLFGLTMPIKMYRAKRLFDGSDLGVYVCSLDDCGQDPIPSSQAQPTIEPQSAAVPGDDQVARLEVEPGPLPEPGWYLRGIRTTVKADGTPSLKQDGSPRVAGGKLKLRVQVAQLTDSAQVTIRPPWHLGEQTDGYPVTYSGQDLSLEQLIVDAADRHGMPPQYLLSQVVKEAAKISTNPLRLNAYTYRYEPYGYDFKYIVGDMSDCCDANGHKLLQDSSSSQQDFPFFRLGLLGGSAKAEMLHSLGVPGDSKLPRVNSIALIPTGQSDTYSWQIPNLSGQPIEWDVDVWDATRQVQCTRVAPGRSPIGQSQFTVDCRTGLVSFGSTHPHAAQLLVSYTPLSNKRVDPSPAANFSSSNVGAMSTVEIAAHCAGCIVPPADPKTTIHSWAASRPLCDDRLTQKIHRYNTDFDKLQSCALLIEDPSFDVQGQWFGGASYGLLQVWPANAAYTIHRGVPSQARPGLRALYDPLTEPGTKLFDPRVSVAFGAAGDAAVDVLDEEDKHSYEGSCVPEVTAPPFNSCSWSRYWARRFAAFNAGSDGSASAFEDYGMWVVTHANSYLPVRQENP